MGTLDRSLQGTPVGNYKRDFILWQGAGSGVTPTATVTGTTRYTFWIDYSNYMTFLRSLVTQNVSFKIWKDAGLTQLAKVYVSFTQSNDVPDSVIRSTGLTIDQAVTPPPYLINTTFLTQPADFNYQNDQGVYVYNNYTGNAFTTGINSKMVQSFVPQSSSVTAVWLKTLFHVGSNSDHTLYQDLVVEIWDSNKNVITSGTISKFALQTAPQDAFNEQYVTADDGLKYWINFDQRRVRFATPAKVIVGQTYYVCVKEATSQSVAHYAVGANINGSGAWNGGNSYIFGQAYSAPWSGTTLTSLGSNVSFCFITQRPNGRTAVTFLWDSPSYYWYNPDVFGDQFRFVKEDSDRRI